MICHKHRGKQGIIESLGELKKRVDKAYSDGYSNLIDFLKFVRSGFSLLIPSEL
jgi:hypothetical protein